MARGIAGVGAAIQSDPIFIEPLHERHRRVVIFAAAVETLLLQHRPEAERGDLAALGAGHRGGADQRVAAVSVSGLRQQVDHDTRLALLGLGRGPHAGRSGAGERGPEIVAEVFGHAVLSTTCP